MIFGTRKYDDNVNITIDDVSIGRVTEIKFLGVMLDTKLMLEVSYWVHSEQSKQMHRPFA